MVFLSNDLFIVLTPPVAACFEAWRFVYGSHVAFTQRSFGLLDCIIGLLSVSYRMMVVAGAPTRITINLQEVICPTNLI